MDSHIDRKEQARQQLRQAALEYHEFPRPGKISVTPTKQLTNQRDLSLAYTPGVAAACEEIVADPDKLRDIIAALEPTFGGVNLEDIKAPECFYIERKLRERMKIPVFHDDQHGTAIIVGAAILNGLKYQNKDIQRCKLVVSGAGAAALACRDLIVDLGFPIENIWVTDLAGVVYQGRVELMDDEKERYAQETDARTLADVIPGADIFLGLSAGGVLRPEMVKAMAKRPLILALANPTPEILPEEVRLVRDDVVMATGRSDYPNQVNNVLCFPYIFRGAL